jgi:hypothetical protein
MTNDGASGAAVSHHAPGEQGDRMEEMTVIPEGAELRTFRDPKQVLGEAALVGNAVDALVRKKPDLVKLIGGRRHPRFELLQIVGTMFRLTARARETRHVLIGDVEGWECDAEAYHIPTGRVVATAQSMCLNDEPNWDTRPTTVNGERVVQQVPTFQRRSMAQTRACSKALRLAIGWVLGMAGYEATAAEEMTGGEYQGDNGGGSYSQPQRKQNSGGAPADGLISEAQGRRLWALAKTANKSNDEVGVIIAHYGFRSSEEITRDKYEAICNEVMKPNRGQQ